MKIKILNILSIRKGIYNLELIENKIKSIFIRQREYMLHANNYIPYLKIKHHITKLIARFKFHHQLYFCLLLRNLFLRLCARACPLVVIINFATSKCDGSFSFYCYFVSSILKFYGFLLGFGGKQHPFLHFQVLSN